MLIKSGIMTQGSGSLGGITASHNKGGMYLRARAIPTDPASAYQTVMRQYMAQLANLWVNTLTADQRAAWETYAVNVTVPNALGDQINLSGLNHYVRSNLPRLQAGLVRVDDGPVVYNLGDFTTPGSFAGTDTGDLLGFTFDNTDAWANEDDAAMLLLGSRQQNQTINYFKGPYRYAGKVDGDSVAPPTSPASIASAFAIDAGTKVFGLWRVSRADGRLSAPFRDVGDVS